MADGFWMETCRVSFSVFKKTEYRCRLEGLQKH